MNEFDFDGDLRHLLVCVEGESCATESKKQYGSPSGLYDAIKSERNRLQLKRKLYVLRTSCQGWCDYAPVCTLLPAGEVRSGVLPEEVSALVQNSVQPKPTLSQGHYVWNFSMSRKENDVLRAKEKQQR